MHIVSDLMNVVVRKYLYVTLNGVIYMMYLNELNWKLSISLTPETQLAKATKGFNVKSEIGIFINDSEAEIELYINGAAGANREMIIFLDQFGAVKKNNIYRIRSDLSHMEGALKILRQVLDIPTVVLGASWVDNGAYYLEFLFNYSDMDAVSDLVLEKLIEIDNVHLNYIGPGNGVYEALAEANKRTPIDIIEIEIKAPEDELGPVKNPMGKEWVRMLKSNIATNKIRAVYFTGEHGSNVKLNYANTENIFEEYLNTRMREERILSIAEIDMLKDNTFRIFTANPAIFTMEYFALISEASKKFKDWKSVVKRVQPYGDWLQNL